MPALEIMLHDNDGKSAQTVNGNKRTIQESRIDKLPLGDGPVKNLEDPSQEAINGEKHDVVKKV